MNDSPIEIIEEKLGNGNYIYYARVSFGKFHGKTRFRGTKEEAIMDAESKLETCRLLEKMENIK